MQSQRKKLKRFITEHLTDSEFNSNCDLEDESNSEDELNYEIESHVDNF